MTARPFPHGTRNGYGNLGCRCEACCRANTDGIRDYRRRLGIRPMAEVYAERRASVAHGTQTKYADHGCRCDECRAFSRRARAYWRWRANGRTRRVRCPGCGELFAGNVGLRNHETKMGCR